MSNQFLQHFVLCDYLLDNAHLTTNLIFKSKFHWSFHLQFLKYACNYVCFQKTERYSSYPVYHSVYETFEIVEKFYDPNFKRLHAVAQVRGGLIFLLADSQLLPLDVNQYADSLRKYALSISQLAQKHPEEMNMFKVSFGENV